MTLRDVLADIHALEEDLLAFERKYGVRSETFYAAYTSGEEPEDERWVLDLGNGQACIVPGSPGKPNTVMKCSGYNGTQRALQA